jgi:hypothetical protein
MKEGVLMSIYDTSINSGDNDCFCPDLNCNAQLIIKKRELKRTAHFAHKPNSQPCCGLETALHLKTKEVLQSLEFLEIPNYVLTLDEMYNFFSNEISAIEKTYDFELYSEVLYENQFENSVITKYFNTLHGRLSCENLPVFTTKKIDLKRYLIQSEKAEGSIIPDITLTKKKTLEKIYIEVGVTHLIDDKKRKKIIKNDLTVLEIDFSKYYKLYNTPELDIEGYLGDKIRFRKEDERKYFSITERWVNISKVGRFLEKERTRIISEFELVLTTLKSIFENEISEIFLEEFEIRSSIIHEGFIKKNNYICCDKNVEELLKCPKLFNFFLKKSITSEEAQSIIAKRQKREQERIDLHNRLWN